MSNKKHETDKELDCHVTVMDGAYMTCDMIEEAPSEKEEIQEDYDI